MIFEVTPEQVAALSDTDLRTLVGYLAEQEVRAQGHSTAAVTYGGHQNARDGGIDVSVDLNAAATKGYVPRARTGFQVKAEDMPRAAILKEMVPRTKLRDAIRELGEATVTALHGRVAELQRRMLVQKRSIWRALLPHALAHRLAKQALQDIPRNVIRSKLIAVAPERLLKSFSRRLGCLHDSKEAQEIVRGWLTGDDWLSKVEDLNELGLVLLDNVAPVNPEATLEAIERAVTRAPEILSDTHRQHSPIVRLLRSLAYDPSHFDRAVRLLAVAASSKESSSNTADAISVYKSLFYLWLSGTHAAVEQRTAFVMRIARELPDSPHLVTSALDALLECDWFSSHYGFEFGARKRDYGFNPRHRSDTYAWYCAVFKLCAELDQTPRLRSAVRMMLANQFRRLATRMYGVTELISLAEGFAADGGWPEGWAGVRGAARELKKLKRVADAALMEQLATKLEPRSIEQRITTYVLPESWSRLDLADIEDIEDDKNYQKANAQIDQICSGIGVELAGDLAALRKHLPIMLSGQTSRAFTVISAVAKHVRDVDAAWNVVLDDAAASAAAGRAVNSPAFFVAGLKERDEEAVERLLDGALADDRLRPIFVTMQINAGVNGRGCERLVRAAGIPEISTLSFMGLKYGGACSKLSGDEFKRMILAIADREDGVAVAAEIMHMRVFGLRSDKRDLSETDQEAGRELLRRTRFSSSTYKPTGDIAKIADACLTTYRDDELARQMCARLSESANSWGVMASDFGDLVAVLGRKFPVAVLDVLVEQPGPESGRNLFLSFRENRPCPLRVIDDNTLLRWAHARPATRFTLLARTVGAWGPPATIEDEDEQTVPAGGRLEWTLAMRRLIRESPDPVAVLQALRERLHPSSWSGSLADELSSRLSLFEALTHEADQRISAWAAAERPKFIEEIEKTRIWEAQFDRERDEKFKW